MSTAVGFIGLGAMGGAMARNLAVGGADLHVYDLRDQAVAPLVEAGARAADSIESLGAACDWIVFSLPDTAAVGAAVTELDPVLRAGHTLIDCGTTDPGFTAETAARLARRGVVLLDAPVSGMPVRAATGDLTIMVGGDEGAYRKVRSLLQMLGTEIVHMGASGNGQLMKITNNVLYNVALAAMAEMLPLAVKAGLDPETVCRVVSAGTGQSAAFDFFAPRLLRRDFAEGYSMQSAHKDMVAVMELARQHGVPLPVASGAAHTYQLALDRGLGRESKAAMAKVWEEALGVEVRAKDQEE